MSRYTLALIAAGLLATGGRLAAHHSYGDVIRNQSVSVEGTLEGFTFANPHAMLTIKTVNSGTFTCEWQAISQLARRGVSKASLRIGDIVVVTGSPTRKSDHELKLLTEVRRASDGWLWSVPLGERGGPAIPAGSVTSRSLR